MTNSNGQFSLELGRKLRDEGIKKAVKSADEVVLGWIDYAYEHFIEFLRKKAAGDEFMIEDFRAYVSPKLLQPKSNRAFGAIAVRAQREGKIEPVGFRSVKNVKAHCAPCRVWKKV